MGPGRQFQQIRRQGKLPERISPGHLNRVLQTFAFTIVTVNDEHTKPRSKSAEIKCKEGIRAELCLKLLFESDWYFCDITKSGCFKATVQEESPKQSLSKLTSEAAVWRCFCKYVLWSLF